MQCQTDWKDLHHVRDGYENNEGFYCLLDCTLGNLMLLWVSIDRWVDFPLPCIEFLDLKVIGNEQHRWLIHF